MLVAGLGYSFFFSATQLHSVKAQGTTDPYSYSVTQEEAEAYYEAVSDCSTPSLECLVRNVSRFTAIEWINDIGGQKGSCISNPDGCNDPLSDAGGQPIASGAIGGLASLIGGMYNNPPASSLTYVADVLDSANIARPAYAQGLGFSAMDPILPLWKTFRNVAYMFFIIIFVITGFLIMFRSKVGQTAITAQQAIPKIIVSLIMVTFSYAIGGFLIDLMYLSMTLIMGVFESVLSGKNYLGMNIFQLGGDLFKVVRTNVDFQDTVSAFFTNLTGAPQALLSVIGGLTLSIIISIALLIGLVKLFFELLRAYATVVISIVISPITLMMNAIPGNNAFMTWIKTLVGHLLPFPTVLVVVAMFGVFTQGTTSSSGGFMPPFLIGSGQSDVITSVLGLAILLALPEIVKHIREAIAPKNAFAEMILKSAGDNFRNTSGVGLRLAGATTMAGAGLGAGLAKGALSSDNRALWRMGERGAAVRSALTTAGRYGGNYASAGSRLGGWINTKLGGKTHALASPLELLVEKGTGAVTEEARLKRMERADFEERSLPKRIKSPGAMSDDLWNKRVQLAELERRRRNAYNAEMQKQLDKQGTDEEPDFSKLGYLNQSVSQK